MPPCGPPLQLPPSWPPWLGLPPSLFSSACALRGDTLGPIAGRQVMDKLQRGPVPGHQANSAHAVSYKTSIQQKISAFLDESLGDGWPRLLDRRSSVVFPSQGGLVVSTATVDHVRRMFAELPTHTSMCVVKTLVNSWTTSARMHEDLVLPCIFGCGSSPHPDALMVISSGPTKPADTLAHYMVCPILWDILMSATGCWWLPPLGQFTIVVRQGIG